MIVLFFYLLPFLLASLHWDIVFCVRMFLVLCFKLLTFKFCVLAFVFCVMCCKTAQWRHKKEAIKWRCEYTCMIVLFFIYYLFY